MLHLAVQLARYRVNVIDALYAVSERGSMGNILAVGNERPKTGESSPIRRPRPTAKPAKPDGTLSILSMMGKVAMQRHGSEQTYGVRR